MAHYAQIINGVVVNVIVVSNEVVGEYPQSDLTGKQFIASIGLSGEWVQTSFNNNFRKQFASKSFTYDAVKDQFVAPQPFASWSLDANNDWQAPTPRPEGVYVWDEESLSWLAIPVG